MMDVLEEKYAESKQTYVHDQKSGYKRKNLEQVYLYLQGNSVSHTQNYVKLADRLASASLDSRVEHYVKKRRLNADIYAKLEANKKIAEKLDLYRREADYDAADRCDEEKITEEEEEQQEVDDQE
jgi:hypothetical protein